MCAAYLIFHQYVYNLIKLEALCIALLLTHVLDSDGAHLAQYIDGVGDVSVDKEPDEAALTAEDSRSRCTKCHSDVETVTDIPPNSVAAIAVQAQTAQNLSDKTLYFDSLSVERPYQVPQVVTQEVMVPVDGLPLVLGRSGREPRGAD